MRGRMLCYIVCQVVGIDWLIGRDVRPAEELLRIGAASVSELHVQCRSLDDRCRIDDDIHADRGSVAKSR